MNAFPERDLCIAYARLPFITPARIRLLLEYFPQISHVPQAPATLLRGLLSLSDEQVRALREPAISAAAAVALTDSSYPALLREIIDPPLALFYRGDLAVLERPMVAVVGSRRASAYGINAARELARQLAGAGVAVVAGLARGIDAAAHEAALEAGGTTVAVLGTGVDVVYPRSHKRLMRRIESEGLVVTEFPDGTPPVAQNFPMRNRIISGLGVGTIIVEATGRSGSLITARMAAEQGREVFAVPGSIFAPGTEGTHRLIQYGAKLVHDIDDVLEELPGNLQSPVAGRRSPEPDSPLREVLDVFNRDEATHIDAAAAKLGISVAAVSERVLQLELGGWLRAMPGARYVRDR
jgi:DNA processing protein